MPKKKTTKKKEIELDPVLSPSASWSDSFSLSYPPDEEYDCEDENKSFEMNIIEFRVKLFWRYLKLRLTVGKDNTDV